MSSWGVYTHWSENGECLYVGCTVNFRARNNIHLLSSTWGKEISSIDFLPCSSKRDARLFEIEMIRELKPKYNNNFSQLPSDKELKSIHYAHTKHYYYDDVMWIFSITGDVGLANFLDVSLGHIRMVRLGIQGLLFYELEIVANIFGCAVLDLPWTVKKRNAHKVVKLCVKNTSLARSLSAMSRSGRHC